MSKIQRVFFAGAGGVGKTSVLNELTVTFHSLGITYTTFPSVVRDFFKAYGLTTEQAGLDRPEEQRMDFQLRLFDFYLKRLKEVTEQAEAQGHQILITDRSPFDHLAYLVYNSPNLLSQQVLDACLRTAAYSLSEDNTKVFLFPCLCPWMNADVVADGMRYVLPGKNFMVHSLIESAMAQQKVVFYMMSPTASVAQRAAQIAEFLGIDGPRIFDTGPIH